MVHTKDQIWIKRVVAEMGGKDGILVDESADIDSAVQGTVAAAFGFSGQKCSACSRVMVHESIYDKVKKSLAKAYKQLKIGNPLDPKMHVGPLIDTDAVN